MSNRTELTESVRDAYEDIRDDNTPTNWALFVYTDDNHITHAESGETYSDFLAKLTDDARMYGYVRMTSGDELSRRMKFALITWVGSDITPLKRAKVSLDKSVLKEAVKSFAVELQTSELDELEESRVLSEINKAGGANYGTGQTDV